MRFILARFTEVGYISRRKAGGYRPIFAYKTQLYLVETLKIDRTKLITMSEYAKLKCISKGRVSQLVKEKKIKTVEIKGAILIYLD